MTDRYKRNSVNLKFSMRKGQIRTFLLCVQKKVHGELGVTDYSDTKFTKVHELATLLFMKNPTHTQDFL